MVVGQSKFESEFPPSVRLTPATFPQGGRLISGSCFAVSNLASPFGWEVGPLGLGGEVGGQSIFVSEFPPSTAGAVPLPPRGTAFSRLLLCSRWGRCVGCEAVLV